MKAIKFTAPAELTKAEIHTFADLHIGDKLCDIATIKKAYATL